MTREKSDKSYSRILAEFAHGLKYDDIPPPVVARVKEHILDTMGCLLAGSAMDWMMRVAAIAKRLGGPPEATIVGDGARVGVSSAALANGSLGRALDLDDTHFRPWEHVSGYIVPTAFTVGEWRGKSGRDVITAVVAGYELTCRVGLVSFRDRIFLHDLSIGSIENRAVLPSGNLFAAALETAKLMGLSVDQMTSAMGFAGSLGLFARQTHREKADAMPFNNGWACHAGVVAAITAETGLRGPEQIFEGDRGYFQAVAPDEQTDITRLVENLGTVWESSQGTIKFYPAGHGTHYFLNSVKALMKEGLRAEDVAEINCFVPRIRAELHFSPHDRVYRPGPYDARFSLPYLLGTMLVDGQVGVRSFTEQKVRDPKILATADRVVHTLDEESWLPDNRGYVVVKTVDGRTLQRRTPHSELPGTPEHPAPREDILNKFRDNASFVLSDPSIEKLAHALETLENVEDVGQIMRMTAPEPGRKGL